MMRRHILPAAILLVLSFEIISACSSPNYYVAPIATPIFTAPWQGSVQASMTTRGKLYVEAAGLLPSNIAFIGTHESWGTGFTNDQRMNSFALGKFWRYDNISLLALGGYGAGAQRVGPRYPITDVLYISNNTLEGGSDFNRFFVELQWASSDEVTTWLYGSSFPISSSSIGLATRLEYLNRYRFSQTEQSPIYNSKPPFPDTALFFDGDPKHTLSLDVAGFASVGIPYLQFIQLYGQLLVHIPIYGYFDYWDGLELTGGVRVTF